MVEIKMTGPIFTPLLYSKEKCKKGIVKYLIKVHAFSPKKAVSIGETLRFLKNLPWRSALSDLVKSRIIVPSNIPINRKSEIEIDEDTKIHLDLDSFILYIKSIRIKAIITLVTLVVLPYILLLIGFIAGRLQTLPWQLSYAEYIIFFILSIVGWVLMFHHYLVWLPYACRRNIFPFIIYKMLVQ